MAETSSQYSNPSGLPPPVDDQDSGSSVVSEGTTRGNLTLEDLAALKHLEGQFGIKSNSPYALDNIRQRKNYCQSKLKADRRDYTAVELWHQTLHQLDEFENLVLKALLPLGPELQAPPYPEHATAPVNLQKVRASRIDNAVIVGIDEYAGSQLDGAVKDAQRIDAYLTTHHSTQVKRLFNKKATYNAILSALCSLYLRRDIDRGSTILIYVACHGLVYKDASGLIGALCPYDRMLEGSSDIPSRLINIILSHIRETTCDNVVFITDCCHAAAMTRGGEQRNLPKCDVNYMLDLAQEYCYRSGFNKSIISSWVPDFSSYVHLAACGIDQSALELSGKGAFTQALLRVLKTHKPPVDMTFEQLLKKVKCIMKESSRDQIPEVIGDGKTSKILFLLGPAKGRGL